MANYIQFDASELSEFAVYATRSHAAAEGLESAIRCLNDDHNPYPEKSKSHKEWLDAWNAQVEKAA